MEKQLKAFFYDFKYYLFPEGCETLTDLKERTHVRVQWLKEERCMAPDFIRESMEEVELAIEAPERIFEVNINLYTAKEYDDILREQVLRVCPGCERFGNDAEDLTGHHEEISLDGTCCLRQSKEDYWDFSYCVDVFWYRVSQMANELAACIDKGNQKKLNKLINQELTKFFYETEFYGCIVDGKYCLCIPSSPYLRSSFAYIYGFIAHAGGQENGEMASIGWLVKPYRVAGAYRYKGKEKGNKPLLQIVEAGSAMQRGVFIYDKSAEKLDNAHIQKCVEDVDNYLCSVMGEDVVRATVSGYRVVSACGELITPDAAADALKALYGEVFSETAEQGEVPFPVPMSYSADAEAGNFALPLRERLTECVTNCPDLSFLEKEGATDKSQNAWLNFLSFAYLHIPRSLDDPENVMNTVMWYFGNLRELAEPYIDPEETRISFGMLGFADCGGEAFVIDMAVASEKRFYRGLRILAPVLSSLGAKLVVVNEEGVMQYLCGYEFTPID